MRKILKALFVALLCVVILAAAGCELEDTEAQGSKEDTKSTMEVGGKSKDTNRY